jgi:PTH1 family peptidyl-tRNA hydrolase
MRLIVGLGNPGDSYTHTRHNAGCLFVDAISSKNPSKDIVLRKSDTFMNDSGTFVKKLVDQYKLNLSNLYIAHDDLDIKLGEYKIQFGKGPKDHNGLNDIEAKLGTNEFWHIRIGVDNRPLDGKPLGIEYVLENFSDEEKQILDKTIIEAISAFLSSR